MNTKALAERALDQGNGIVRLAPAWVPRVNFVPGRRIKLHPDDYYAFGTQRGGIDERWFASTTPADNGPLTSPNEGLSFVVYSDGMKTEQVLLRDAVAELKEALIGDRLWIDYGGWPAYAKFFDNRDALPFHMHMSDEHAKLIGQIGKSEAYYFPRQLNGYRGTFPYTFFGLKPGTTTEQVRACLERFSKGDNKITGLSRAYRLELGTGWDVPAGVLHAPGSLCTYEPQQASDVYSLFESVVAGSVISEQELWKDCPEEHKRDYEYLLGTLDWDLNVDPDFAQHRLMRPVPVKRIEEMRAEGYIENWICYRSKSFSAKELTVLPGRTVTVRDSAAYGMIMLQGHGRMGVWEIETPTMIRFGQLTNDELFVSERPAREGVKITNLSGTEPIVMLKHFGPKNPDLVV
jgi:hypothetical protein